MLDAAESEFAGLGFEAATMDRIAASAGASKSHLYYHFDSKDDLLAAVFTDRVEGILADKERMFAGKEELDDALVEKVLSEGVATLLASHANFLRIVVLECFRPGGRADLSFGVLRLVSDDSYARFRAFGLAVESEELISAITWFGLLPILAEMLIGGEAASALGLDPVRQHTIFERQMAEVYHGYLTRLRATSSTAGGAEDARGS
ncbi:MAG: TetR/AcrR family transcriptional regulator [Propionibacteriaceae bacterium]|nr:TetR/AcrR family transcriptional regulator [Propionibacteriaceae bacterium]